MVSTSRWSGLLQAEDDALGDLGHLALAVLDRQFGAGGDAARVIVINASRAVCNRSEGYVIRWGVSFATQKNGA